MVIILFVIGALIYVKPVGGAFPEHNVMNDLDSLLFGFSALLQGNIGGFFDGFVEGLPIIALFIVMFAIMHYLFAYVLKSIFPKKNVATILALVMALYGFYDQRIYNALLSLNAFAIGALVFSALIIMIWGLTEHGINNMQHELRDLSIKHKKGKTDKNDIRRIKDLITKIEREGQKPRM